MLSFSGWDLFGNMSSTLNHQGVNMLINMFFGVVYNAASSVATSIRGVVETFSSNVIQAFRPQIIKNYACQNYERMENLMYNGLKFSLLLFLLLTIPVAVEAHKILELWLGIVPEYSDVFCRLLLIISLFNLINKILTISIAATGFMKSISLITGSLYLLALPAIYIVFKFFDVTPAAAYIVVIITMFLIVGTNVAILKAQAPQLHPLRYLQGVAEPFLAMILSVIPVIPVYYMMDSSIFRIVCIFLVYAFTLSLVTYFIFIGKDMRWKFNHQLKSFFKRGK